MSAGDRYAWDTDGLRQGAKHKSHHTQKPTVKFASGLHGMVRRNFVTMLLLRPCDRLPPFDGFDYFWVAFQLAYRLHVATAGKPQW